MKFTNNDILKLKLSKLEIGESVNKTQFIDEHDYYDILDPFKSFESGLAKIKKMFPDKEFKTIKGNVTRIK
jgi:hypothetical protein